jgi:hypothetical protein
MLTLIFSICIGVHGLSHLGLEKIYNYSNREGVSIIFAITSLGDWFS